MYIHMYIHTPKYTCAEVLTCTHMHTPADPAYMSSPISIVFTWTIVGAMLRFRYYFIWLLTESINNAAGLGFSGYVISVMFL